MPRNIDYDGLELAMTSAPLDGDFYFEDATGEVFPVWGDQRASAEAYADLDDIEDTAERLAWCELWDRGRFQQDLTVAQVDDLQRRVARYMDGFRIVPQIPSREEYQDMEAFIATLTDRYMRQRLEDAIEGSGADRRFKNVLFDYPEQRQEWFDFRDARLRDRVRAWLEQSGIED